MTEKTFDPPASPLHVSVSPHIRHPGSVPAIMISVIIALAPAFIGSVVFFGARSCMLTCACIAAAVATEWSITALLRKPASINDYSAIVTGMLLAFNLPPDLPVWMAMLGSVFAIGVVKMAFGGLGSNFMNPALAGRAFLMVSYPAAMTQWSAPIHGTLSGFSRGIEGVTAATPLAFFKAAAASGHLHQLDLREAIPSLFWGNTGGCIGETSAALLVLGALFLWYRRIIGFVIPSLFIGTVFLFFWISNGSGEFFSTHSLYAPLYQILSGGLMLGALFMATDTVTSPITPWGKVIFGMGCGILTVVIRKFGGYPEGVCYAILLMNCVVPLLDRYTRPKRFGKVKIRE
jgi:electron transport complex, RnfABCDGE type, D subunit